MRLTGVSIQDHPGIGSIDVSFKDVDGVVFDTIVLAGANGCGKTALLEAITAACLGDSDMNVGLVTLYMLLDSFDKSLIDANASTRFNPPRILPDEVIWVWDSRGTDSSAREIRWTDSELGEIRMSAHMRTNEWRHVFGVFFNEANVAFNADKRTSVTTLSVDEPGQTSDRSGAHLAVQIAQLLIDIRAQDNEDYVAWCNKNPGEIANEQTKAPRLWRFTTAISYMFPKKRFVGVRRTPKAILIEFEENGRICSIDDLSTGEKQIVYRGGFLLRNLANTKSSLILIDEPELSLHPEWQDRILGFYTKILSDTLGKHPQLIVATHSPFIIHAAANAKVIILKKDVSAGSVKVLENPSFPSVRGHESVFAFNIDGFLASAKQPLLVLTEGETDACLIRAAWRKLRPDTQMHFELRAALGMKNLNITLNDDQLFTKLGARRILGIFDFDNAYDQWNGVWRHTSAPRKLVSSNVSEGLVNRHPTEAGWAMLLPVPSFRRNFASADLAGRSILSIEFMFRDEDIPPHMIDLVDLACSLKLPSFRVNQKSNFVTHALSLSADSYTAFEPLLTTFERILAGQL